MGICKLCKKDVGLSVHCSMGSICSECSKNIGIAQFQPLHSFSSVLWVLAETYFRKGTGEEVDFEEVWKENENLKLVKFGELFNEKT